MTSPSLSIFSLTPKISEYENNLSGWLHKYGQVNPRKGRLANIPVSLLHVSLNTVKAIAFAVEMTARGIFVFLAASLGRKHSYETACIYLGVGTVSALQVIGSPLLLATLLSRSVFNSQNSYAYSPDLIAWSSRIAQAYITGGYPKLLSCMQSVLVENLNPQPAPSIPTAPMGGFPAADQMAALFHSQVGNLTPQEIELFIKFAHALQRAHDPILRKEIIRLLNDKNAEDSDLNRFEMTWRFMIKQLGEDLQEYCLFIERLEKDMQTSQKTQDPLKSPKPPEPPLPAQAMSHAEPIDDPD